MTSLHWRHNEHNGVSNQPPRDCLLNFWFRRRSKETSKLRVTGLFAGNSPVTGEFPAQKASNAENVSIWLPQNDFEVPQHCMGRNDQTEAPSIHVTNNHCNVPLPAHTFNFMPRPQQEATACEIKVKQWQKSPTSTVSTILFWLITYTNKWYKNCRYIMSDVELHVIGPFWFMAIASILRRILFGIVLCALIIINTWPFSSRFLLRSTSPIQMNIYKK